MIPKILIIGCGRIAGWHCRAIKSQKNIKLLGVCDLNISKAKEYGSKFKVPFYTNYRKMIEDIQDANTVAIITPSECILNMLMKFYLNIKKI